MDGENNSGQPGAPAANEAAGKTRNASGKKKTIRKPKAASRYVVMLERHHDDQQPGIHSIIGEGATMSAAWDDAIAKEIPGVAQCYCLRGQRRTMAEQRKFGFTK